MIVLPLISSHSEECQPPKLNNYFATVGGTTRGSSRTYSLIDLSGSFLSVYNLTHCGHARYRDSYGNIVFTKHYIQCLY